MIKKKISIVIPSHNEARHLPKLLRSIDNLLMSLFDPQIVVVDNGSSDGTQELLKDMCLVLKRIEKKEFPSIVRNFGTQFAANEVLIFLDADTEVTEAWGKRLNQIWDELDRGDLLVTGAKCSVPNDPTMIEKYWFDKLGVGSDPTYINGCNIVTNKTTFQTIGGFDEELETGEDVDFAKRSKQEATLIRHDSAFRVIHHGYPKSLMAFIRRELWHSTGDLVDRSHFFRSKVALASLLFLFFHTFALISLIFEIAAFSICVLGIVLICMLSSVRAFRKTSLYQILMGTLIYYFYYTGRAAGIIKKSFF